MNTVARQFAEEWSRLIDTVERQLHEAKPDVLAPEFYQRVIRAELDKWLQPEHHRGAWMRSLSDIRPEAAATLRQRLTEMPLPDRDFSLTFAHRTALLVCGSIVAAAVIGCYVSPARFLYAAMIISLLLLLLIAALWILETRRRRRQAIALIRDILQREGSRLFTFLEDL